MTRLLFACLLVVLSAPAKADIEASFKEKVASIGDKYQEIDKRAVDVLKDSKPDFSKYAEIRNEIVRFIPEPRREILQAHGLAEEQASQRIQTEQELKVLLSDLNIDVTDDDNKPVPFSALMPRTDQAITENKEELESEGKELTDLARERSAKLAKQRAEDSTPEEKASLPGDLRKLLDEIGHKRSDVQALRAKGEQLKRAKELLAKVIDYSDFSQKFGPDIARLESIETRASQRVQQIDEAIFNFLLVESNDKRYTLYSTIVFGIAVVIVIGAFFFVAYKSEAVRAAIFANDSGLQFVTLFSLVIAIILFGVLKILEGRELAALLGGLSGYILGRGGISRQASFGGSGQPSPVVGPAST
ncbi:MAG TPA: hypothetical protein VNZ48_11075 [Xanthobacteraceae bacterium]|jgi:hypothetical protein|nr:hypothetical protein [Xanthobacteraceae bacterium]